MTREQEVQAALLAIARGQRAERFESATLDFKQEKKTEGETARDILDACLCFANANGGVVVLGVADKAAGADAFIGYGIDAAFLQRRIFDLSRPSLVVDVRTETRFARPILLLFVPRSPDIHADTQGRAPRRVGTTCLTMDPAEQARLRDERAGFDWSAQPSARPHAEASPVALEVARRRLGSFTDRRREYRRLS